MKLHFRCFSFFMVFLISATITSFQGFEKTSKPVNLDKSSLISYLSNQLCIRENLNLPFPIPKNKAEQSNILLAETLRQAEFKNQEITRKDSKF